MDVTVMILTSEEAENIKKIVPEIKMVMERLGILYEIMIVDNNSRDGTDMAAAQLGARVIRQKKPGFGHALREGFSEAHGDFILTLDADFSHPPLFISDLWRERDSDIVVASRWVQGGRSDQTVFRRFLSLFMNVVFRMCCSIPTRDLNSNFRLYRKEVFSLLKLEGKNFEILPEILVRAHAGGLTIKEIPFHYRQRTEGVSKLRVLSFGVSYFFMLVRLVRNHNLVKPFLKGRID